MPADRTGFSEEARCASRVESHIVRHLKVARGCPDRDPESSGKLDSTSRTAEVRIGIPNYNFDGLDLV